MLEDLTKTASMHSHLVSCTWVITRDLLQTFYNVIILFSQARRVFFWNRGQRICEDCVLSIWKVHFISIRLSTLCWWSITDSLICGPFYAQLWIWQSEGLLKNLLYNNLHREQVQWEDKCLTKYNFFVC